MQFHIHSVYAAEKLRDCNAKMGAAKLDLFLRKTIKNEVKNVSTVTSVRPDTVAYVFSDLYTGGSQF